MKKQKEEGKYIHASFIGKVWEGNNINKPYSRKREKYTKIVYIPPLLY